LSKQNGVIELNEAEQRFRRRQRQRLAQYLRLRDEVGQERALEILLEGYPEQQRQLMGPYITGATLAEGFGKVRERFLELGIREEIVDVSTGALDAAIEVLTVCMCRNACDELGLSTPCPLLCELDFEATRRAFPDVTVDVCHRMVDGGFACIFRYSRPSGGTSHDAGARGKLAGPVGPPPQQTPTATQGKGCLDDGRLQPADLR
jgi:predicted ArsR family transcriptional regulator